MRVASCGAPPNPRTHLTTSTARLKHGSCLLRGHRSEEHTSELQSHSDLVCRLLLEKKKIISDCTTFVCRCVVSARSAIDCDRLASLRMKNANTTFAASDSSSSFTPSTTSIYGAFAS